MSPGSHLPISTPIVSTSSVSTPFISTTPVSTPPSAPHSLIPPRPTLSTMPALIVRARGLPVRAQWMSEVVPNSLAALGIQKQDLMQEENVLAEPETLDVGACQIEKEDTRNEGDQSTVMADPNEEA
ncbi:hypothetical protein LWI28_003644 [Acer negundo]|uniref:Uncharacterized protein n=1 Tax=Acer negundo TaxID=4023 RepID=A0AAD5ICR0_ACENE|nr:hypothetical protein LWI28_003644 [Acer negundo]